MKKYIQIAALILVLAVSVFALSFCLIPVSTASSMASEKISSELAAQFELSKEDYVSVMVWFSDIDPSAIDQLAETATLGVAAETSSLQGGETQGIDEVQEYIRAKRVAATELYTEYNQKVAEELFSENEIIYISRYSPVVLARLDSASAQTLATSSLVESIALYNADSFSPVDGTTDEAEIISLGDVNKITWASTVNTSSSYGYTGEGVIIGMFDGYLPSAENFSDYNNIYYDPNGVVNSLGTHSSIVLEIMLSIAPDATYYITSLANSSVSNSLCMERIEWLLDQNVNIINSSIIEGSDGFDSYGDMSKWLDHISYQHNVHFVQASGNSGGTNDEEGLGVQSGGMAYNVITVGSIDTKGTLLLIDDSIWGYSSYYGEAALAQKPDLCAPGAGIKTRFHEENNFYSKASGTSFAAPQVSAAIALLCDQRPALLTQQKTVKAILTASVNFDSLCRYVPGTDNYKKYGAGLLDCLGACWVVGNYRYTSGSMPANGTDRTHTFTVTSSDSRIRVALSWNIKSLSSADGHGTITSADTALPDLNLKVIDPNGNDVMISATTNNNVEIVDFVPTMTGTYTIVVMCGDNVTRTVPYSRAWR